MLYTCVEMVCEHVKTHFLKKKLSSEKRRKTMFERSVTRRVEFTILTSRVIRLQGKFDFDTMRHIGTLKVKSLKNKYAPCVQISIWIPFREGILLDLTPKKYWNILYTCVEEMVCEQSWTYFFKNWHAIFKKQGTNPSRFLRKIIFLQTKITKIPKLKNRPRLPPILLVTA